MKCELIFYLAGRTSQLEDLLEDLLAGLGVIIAEVTAATSPEELAAALEKLPQRERDVIILHYYSGISLREISEAIGMSYSNMKIIHRKALAGLKKHLDI